jgi:hypothetical protein
MDDSEEDEDRNSKERSAVAGKTENYYTLALIVVLISATLLCQVFNSVERRKGNKRIKPHFLFNYDTCPVYTVQSNSASLSEQKKNCF